MTDPRYYFARGNTYRIVNEYNKAILDYSSAIRLDSGTANYYSNRGQSYRTIEKPQVALNDFDAALAMEPGNTSLFFPSGMAFSTSRVYNDWDGDLFVGSLQFKYVARLFILDKQALNRQQMLDSIGRVRNLKECTDGYLYSGFDGTCM